MIADIVTEQDVDICLKVLREARTVAAVNELARSMHGRVQAMEADPVLYPRALHIKNLAAYRRICIEKGWT